MASDFFLSTFPNFCPKMIPDLTHLQNQRCHYAFSAFYPLSHAVYNNYYNDDNHKHELTNYAQKYMYVKPTYFSLLAYRASE